MAAFHAGTNLERVMFSVSLFLHNFVYSTNFDFKGFKINADIRSL